MINLCFMSSSDMTCGATTWRWPTTWRQGASPAGCTWPSAPSTISGWSSSTFPRCGSQDGTSQGRVRGGGRSWPPAQPVPQRELHHNLLHRPPHQQVRGEWDAFPAGRFSIIILLAKRKTDTQNFYCTSFSIDCSPKTRWEKNKQKNQHCHPSQHDLTIWRLQEEAPHVQHPQCERSRNAHWARWPRRCWFDTYCWENLVADVVIDIMYYDCWAQYWKENLVLVIESPLFAFIVLILLALSRILYCKRVEGKLSKTF